MNAMSGLGFCICGVPGVFENETLISHIDGGCNNRKELIFFQE